MTFIFMQFSIVISTAALFLAINGINEWIISELQFIPGMNWLSLPAGLCVLATLMLGFIGTAGILVAYLLLNFLRFKFSDFPHAFLNAVAHSAGPYLVYLFADRFYGFNASLANLTSNRLLVLILICSVVCSTLQAMTMIAAGDTGTILQHSFYMIAGNTVGALLLTYMLKAISAAVP